MPRPPTSSPPPASSFSFAAGSFDYPHASTSPPNAARSHPGNVLRLADEPPERSPGQLDRLMEARRRVNRRRLHRLLGPPRDSDEGVYDALRRPPTAYSDRPRATPSERYLQRTQSRINEERQALLSSNVEPFDSLSERPPIIADFEEWINMTNRQPSPPEMTQRRSKRRKLDHDTSRPTEYHNYKYGYKGQVVPGRLRMEVVSCDGGQIKRDNPMKMYDVENVLKNDKSVYCSESSKCNLLLKHVGDAPFALEKVVIRAPDRGFTSPVQEGLIFVAMSAEELLSGTSTYQLQHRSHSPSASPSPERRRYARNAERISLREAMDDPDIWQHSRRRLQDDVEARIERLRLRTRRLNQESHARAFPENQRSSEPPAGSDDEVDFDCDYTVSAGVSAPTPPPFNVTTTSEEDEESSNDDYPNVETMADRIQREGRWRPGSDDEEEDVAPRRGTGARFRQLLETAQFADDYDMRARRMSLGPRYRNLLDNTEPIRASRLSRPSLIYAGADDLERGDVLAPHAGFFIKKNKSKITIKFEPAISGRNVLLKLWSPKDSEDGNIDIESVQFYGYSGPRFFQATEAC